MNFKSDKQRRAAFAHMNRFSESVWGMAKRMKLEHSGHDIRGYTGSAAHVSGEADPLVFIKDQSGGYAVIKPDTDTVILAGSGYKGIGDTGPDDIEYVAAEERKRGRPVFAKREIYTREVKDAASLLEDIIVKDGFPAGEHFLESMADNDDKNVRIWASRNLELLQSGKLYRDISKDISSMDVKAENVPKIDDRNHLIALRFDEEMSEDPYILARKSSVIQLPGEISR